MSSSNDEQERKGLAERLRHAREYVGLTKDEAAKALGLSQSSVNSIESGAQQIETLILHKLAKLYRRSPEYLTTGCLPPPSGPDQLAFLARASKGLSQQDMDEVARFADFLKNSPESNS